MQCAVASGTLSHLDVKEIVSAGGEIPETIELRGTIVERLNCPSV